MDEARAAPDYWLFTVDRLRRVDPCRLATGERSAEVRELAIQSQKQLSALSFQLLLTADCRWLHSYRSATMGSTLVARRAGKYPATKAMAERMPTAAIMVTLSRGPSPNSIC
jgi:hypothetical protein